MTVSSLAACVKATTLALGVLVASGTANAAKIGVRVLDATTGLPVPHASVCLGTASNPTIYGTGVTSFSGVALYDNCLLYTSPSPRDATLSRMPSSA